MRIAARVVTCLALCAAATAQEPPRSAREEYRALNGLLVDRSQIYYVRELNLRRDVVSLSFTEGKLALFSAHDGRVTGAVFTGQGRALALPRDPAERMSLARYLETPLLDLAFNRAYLRFDDRTGEELREQLRAAEAQTLNDPAFADEWDATAINLNPWHSLRILTDLLSAAPQPYFYAGLVSPVKGPFDILVDGRRSEQVLIGQPQPRGFGAGDRREYAIWASFPASDGEKPRPAFAPVSYQVETTVRPDSSLEGSATLVLAAAKGSERMVPLELSRLLRVRKVTDAGGNPLEFFQNQGLRPNEVAQDGSAALTAGGNDPLYAVLADAPRAGENVTLRLTYEGSTLSEAGGSYLAAERGTWYPRAAGSHAAKHDLSFRWPAGLELTATGRRVEYAGEGEWRTGRWQSEAPISGAGFALGAYERQTVEDSSVRVTVLAAMQSSTTSGSPAQKIAGASPGTLSKQLGQDLIDAIRFYERFLGAFPFKELLVTPVPGTLSHGWPGLVFVDSNAPVPYEEVVRQWWDATMESANYRDAWIREGLAQYLALLYAQSRHPDERPLTNWLERSRADLASKSGGAGETPADVGPLVLGARLRSAKIPGSYQKVIHGKGPWVFHMLWAMMRDPAAKEPDAAFAEMLRSLAESRRPVTTRVLQAALEKRMTPAMDLEENGKMDWFFDQWVAGTGIPRYRVSFDVKRQGSGFVVQGTLKQEGVSDMFLAAVPLYSPGAGGGEPTLLGTVETTGPETSFQFPSRTRPSQLLIDPDLTLLCWRE